MFAIYSRTSGRKNQRFGAGTKISLFGKTFPNSFHRHHGNGAEDVSTRAATEKGAFSFKEYLSAHQ